MPYHINNEGQIVPCRAKKGHCPFGGNLPDDFTLAEAKEFNKEKEATDEIFNQKKFSNSDYNTVEAMEREAFVEKSCQMALDSRNTYNTMRDDDGNWDTERQLEHQEILNSLLKEAHTHAKNENKLIMSAGLPGAGKSYTLNNYVAQELGVNMNDYVTVNADDMKEIFADRGMIPQIDGMSPMECAQFVHQECSYLAKQYATILRSQGFNVIYDCTAKNFKSTKIEVDKYLNSGYKVEDIQIVYVDVSTDTSFERTKTRYRDDLNNSERGGDMSPNMLSINVNPPRRVCFVQRTQKQLSNFMKVKNWQTCRNL